MRYSPLTSVIFSYYGVDGAGALQSAAVNLAVTGGETA
ncbi:Uncharacterised protein [Serratia marcescens]|nr:hypothetical protein AZZ98_004249 [Serratia marcescens]CAI1789137.1 Uncharacterised protein [Serratia marcescens]CAI1933719.1 Uncharacterised protein [Serratia marcescens]CAI1943691.1 Uncharacterised protein [Serratia marcescens]CAI2152536.1 Uncharacterised protein [Serratia marcescens]